MQDAIEDSIDIDATAEEVWPLVSEPGWWINEDAYREHLVEERDGLVLVTDEQWGVFPLVVVRSEQPRHVAFRWLQQADDPSPDGPGTLTEFWIEDRPGGVTLKVRESGFSTLGKSERDTLADIDGNTEGWRKELAIAKRHVESALAS